MFAVVSVQEELSRKREEKSCLKEQCKHLEARRRHADRYDEPVRTTRREQKLSGRKESISVILCVGFSCLKASQVELSKVKEEQSHAQLLREGVVRDAAATQQRVHGMTSPPLKGLNKYCVRRVTRKVCCFSDFRSFCRKN